MDPKTQHETGLQLTNTMSRRKERFRPRSGTQVKIFTCGPSIYRRPHLGNYRTFLYEDILVRYLEYSGYEVNRVISVTDVEDKSIAEAKRENLSVEDLISPVIETFIQESAMLHIELPEVLPRASNSMDEAVRLIAVLLEKGYAYRHNDNIYFEPKKFPSFGRLYGLDMNRWPKKTVRFSLDTYPGQRWNLGDFILWHAHTGEDVVFWDTEIGKGRPSWNIQDPAIISKHLGPEIDIHCGGIDNIYRHHDYNIAVMEAASGKELAPFWLHGEHLIVDGTKMSKEKGNVVYPEDLTDKGYTGDEIRFYLIYGYYRKKKNLTTPDLERTVAKLRHAKTLIRELLEPSGSSSEPARETVGLIERIEREFRRGMDDDLHVKAAVDGIITVLEKLAGLKRSGSLTDRDSELIAERLDRVDRVLRVFSRPYSESSAGM